MQVHCFNTQIERGTHDYRSANLALFIAGFVTFSTLYTVQPLLPLLVTEFAISPATASLALSTATFALAWMLPISGSISDAFGRKRLMGIAMLLTALLALATAVSPSLPTLLAVRLLQGAGVLTLRNRVTTIPVDGGLLEIGGCDYQFNPLNGDAYARIVSAWPRRAGVPRLLLVHDPRAFASLPVESADLVLSGHTHGGQVRFPLIGSVVQSSKYGERYVAGHVFENGHHLFVTTGIGTSIVPVRLGVPPEIVLLTLKSAGQ